jgi:hypothetical protein
MRTGPTLAAKFASTMGHPWPVAGLIAAGIRLNLERFFTGRLSGDWQANGDSLVCREILTQI